jgi:hypothetical protein
MRKRTSSRSWRSIFLHSSFQPPGAILAAAPAVVVDAFYRVRFGLSPLDNLAAQKVEQALAELLTSAPQ